MKINKIFAFITALATSTAVLAAEPQLTVLSLRDTITDPSLVYPESYEADTHEMLRNWYMQNYVVLDRDLDGTDDVEVSDAVVIERLQHMPTKIEMPFNSIVRNYIDMYTKRRRQLIENMLGMSIYYMPIFEQALEVEGVPLELKYLPIIESALNPNAVSRAGATGLWQFMLPTARGLGMEINSLVDERRDPVTSSRMAARYLRQLYDIYGDWSLAIAAYNCGPGNVNKALRQAGEGKKDFWEIYQFLPAETRGYVPTFIAANYAMNYYDKHNISPALARRPIITDSVHVNRRVHFRQISEVLNIPIEEIRAFNPQYREDIIPGDIRPYPLVLPAHQALGYVVSEDSIAQHNAHLYLNRSVVEPAVGTTRVSTDGDYIITEDIQYYKVRRGDTFAKVARKFGVTEADIKRVNGIRTLRRGRTIKIVTTRRTKRPAEETAPDTLENPVEVQADETNEDLVNEAIEEVEAESEMLTDAEAAGEAFEAITQQTSTPTVEVAPAPTPQQSRNDQPQYHKVKSGENLYKISQKYGTTVARIQSLNPSINGSRINAGQRIRVK